MGFFLGESDEDVVWGEWVVVMVVVNLLYFALVFIDKGLQRWGW